MSDALVLAPPALAILVALATRNVYWALGLAILASETLLAGANPALGALSSVDRAVGVFESAGNARVLLFCLLIGALLAYMRDSGGVAATARALMGSGLAATRRRAQLAPAAAGTAIFVETNASLLASGVLGRPLFDAHGIGRARLAYVIDSTSAPVSVLALLNGWGAYALGLVEAEGFENAVAVVAGSVAWNVYAIATLAGVWLTGLTDRVFGPMAGETPAPAAELGEEAAETGGRALYMWAPLLVMVAGAVGFMWWTGGGNLMAGSGSQSILWAVVLATGTAYALLRGFGVFGHGELQARGFAGIGEMVPVVTVLFLSIALGDSLRALGTGAYIAEAGAALLSPALAPALVFAAAGLTAFMTGTSWGTYGIMIPIAMPLAGALGLPPSLMLAAVLGGGVFGDHCSPISDTTVIASLAAGCDHMEHVRTQLPYALAAAALTLAAYVAAGAALG